MNQHQQSSALASLLQKLAIEENAKNQQPIYIASQSQPQDQKLLQEKQPRLSSDPKRHFDSRLFNNMLLSSFSLIDLPEHELWEDGITNFHQLLVSTSSSRVNIMRKEERSKMEQQARQILRRYYAKDYWYFWNNLNNKWRMLDSIREIAYFDIETTGLRHLVGKDFEITSIILFDGKSLRKYVNGINLEQFKQDIKQFKAVVTFNGNRFDLPQTAKQLGIDWTGIISFDLITIYREFGIKGGLKKIKQELGIMHPVLKDVNGLNAPVLWSKYLNGDAQALKVLQAYNAEDVIPMRYMLEYACQLIRYQDGMSLNTNEIKEANLRKLARIKQEGNNVMKDFLKQINLDLDQVKRIIEGQEDASKNIQ